MAIRPYGEGGVKRINVCPIPCKVRKLNLAMLIKATFQLDFYTLVQQLSKKLLHYKIVSSTFQTHRGVTRHLIHPPWISPCMGSQDLAIIIISTR